MNKLRIGTLVSGENAVSHIPQIIPYGFESFSITFWQTTGDIDLKELASKVNEQLEGKDAIISSISIYGNPLTGHGDNSDTLASWERLIDNAHLLVPTW